MKKDATSFNLPGRKNEIIKGLQGVLEHRFSDAHTDLVKGSIITRTAHTALCHYVERYCVTDPHDDIDRETLHTTTVNRSASGNSNTMSNDTGALNPDRHDMSDHF